MKLITCINPDTVFLLQTATTNSTLLQLTTYTLMLTADQY